MIPKINSSTIKSRGIKKGIFILAFLLVVIVLFFYHQNNVLQITNVRITNEKIRDDVAIVHLSDLHGKLFGKGNHKLIAKVSELSPDMIVFTGDLIDSSRNVDECVSTLEKLAETAPVYYIPGNHEYRSGQWENISNKLKQTSIIMMSNEVYSLVFGETDISILGIDYLANNSDNINEILDSLAKLDSYKIVLDHFPENFNQHLKYDIDLVLSGHAHGGQFIIPLLGGLYSPGQGFFPEYYKGIYKVNNKCMVVSRGLGNSVIPVRIFNRPEIIYIRLTSE